MSESKLTDSELESLCAKAYRFSNEVCALEVWVTMYTVTRELIELRALRDGKPAFVPTVIGEAAQAGAVCDDIEAEHIPHGFRVECPGCENQKTDPAYQDQDKSFEP